VKHEQDGDLFEKNTNKTKFIKGFEALNNEYIFSKSNYSCFSSSDFTKLVEKNKSDEFVIIGYSSTLCCLSTIIEAYHKGLNITYITDASMVKSNKYNEQITHDHAIDILCAYSNNMKTNDFIKFQ